MVASKQEAGGVERQLEGEVGGIEETTRHEDGAAAEAGVALHMCPRGE